MKPNRERFGKIGLADDDGDLVDPESVPKHDKAGHRARRERNEASLAIANEFVALAAKRSTASASTATINASNRC